MFSLYRLILNTNIYPTVCTRFRLKKKRFRILSNFCSNLRKFEQIIWKYLGLKKKSNIGSLHLSFYILINPWYEFFFILKYKISRDFTFKAKWWLFLIIIKSSSSSRIFFKPIWKMNISFFFIFSVGKMRSSTYLITHARLSKTINM